MEFFQCGDLQRYIESGINEDGAKIICSQLLDGISLLHSLGFTHRDLKPQVRLTRVFS
jgi:serine/threonine protein kinase